MNSRTESTATAPGAGLSARRTAGSGPIRRRSVLKALGIAGVALGSGLGGASRALAAGVTPGDVAILRFVAAAEILESDLWVQYTELAMGNPSYNAALMKLDEDMPQYISDNTNDEISHAAFLNAFLASVGAQPVNLDAFRTLPSSPAKGAAKMGRLTNLTALTVDTSWWIRYRSPGNPDFGDTFPQLINIVNQPAIPVRDNHSADEMQAIANTAGFHFATIEQGGTSLYASMIPKATDLDVVHILAGIGGSEVNHFAIWHDKAGNAPAVSVNGLVFPDLGKLDGDALRQKNLIMPKPCKFLRADLPACSVIRPSSTEKAGAVAAATALTNSGLFAGQSAAFFSTLNGLAADADKAVRG
jgi:Ferritin-like domain